MRTLSICLACLVLVPATGVLAQSADVGEPSIMVIGTGEVSRTPDFIKLDFSYRGEGRSQVEALRDLTTKQAAVETGLRHLAGAEKVKIEPGKLQVEAARNKGCDAGDDDDNSKPRLSSGACAIAGFVASMDVTADIEPAAVGGNAASLAAQLGAIGVRTDESGVNDVTALRRAADAAALADASAQAQALAGASGVRLGPVIRIIDNDARGNTVLNEVVVTARLVAPPMVAPEVPVNLSPPPVKVEARIVVIYSILH